MDEMNLNLGSRWMRKLASKLIVRFIKKYFEVDTELDLDELKISYVDGDVVVKTEFIGKPVVLNFWATWCGYCKMEMPAFEEKYQQFLLKLILADCPVILSIKHLAQIIDVDWEMLKTMVNHPSSFYYKFAIKKY